MRNGFLMAIAAVAGAGCIGGGDGKSEGEELFCDGELPDVLVDDPDAEVDYVINCAFPVSADQTLTIEPGVTIRFGEGGGIYVDGGVLDAPGTAEAPITLAASDAAVGWIGVRIFGDQTSTLENVNISGAGLETPEGAASLIVGTVVYAQGSASIRDCVLEAGFAEGLHLYGQLPKFTGNRITGHVVPVVVTDESIDQMTLDNDLKGNDTDAVEIIPQPIPPTKDQTWPLIPVPYWIRASLTFDGEQTVGAGNSLHLQDRASIITHAPIRMEGTQAAPIIIDGATHTSGDWNSVYLTGGKSYFSHVEFRNGSGTDDIFGQAGMLIIDANTGGSVEIRDCVFDGGEAWGVWIGLPDSYNEDIESVNTFGNNAEGAVHYPE